MSYQERVFAIYQTYAPDKLSTVDSTLDKYKGNEEALLAALVKKYGPEPTGGAQQQPRLAEDYRRRILAMYERYAPEKISGVMLSWTSTRATKKHLLTHW